MYHPLVYRKKPQYNGSTANDIVWYHWNKNYSGSSSYLTTTNATTYATTNDRIWRIWNSDSTNVESWVSDTTDPFYIDYSSVGDQTAIHIWQDWNIEQEAHA